MGIRRLARELNLSIGTVSRALNDQPDVKAETRARVKEAALKSGYVPNQSGRSLRKGTTGIVAALIPTGGPGQGSDGGLLRLLEGARRTLLRRDLDLIVLFRGPDDDPMENLRRVVSRRIADAIIITQTAPDDPRLSFLKSAGVEHAALGRSESQEGAAWVDFDFETVARESVRMFLRDGHRRLALVQSDRGMNYEAIMAREFRAEAAKSGLSEDAVTVLGTRHGRIDDEARALFGDISTRATAILAGHESIASRLYAELAALGLGVGTDVALVSTSPTVDHPWLIPALSFFDADLDAAGVALGDLLIALLDAPPDRRDSIPPALLPMRFVARESHGFSARHVRA